MQKDWSSYIIIVYAKKIYGVRVLKLFNSKLLKMGFLLTFMSVFLFSSLGYTENKSKRVLVIAGDENYPPYEFVDSGDKSFRGINNDVMLAISIETGVEIKLVPMEWEDAKTALLNGEVDAIQGMTKSESRENLYSFSKPYIKNSQVIFVRADTNYINDIKDLQFNSIAVQKGDVNSEQEIKGAIIKTYSNQVDAISALLNEEAEAFLGNKMTGLYTLQKMKRLDKVKIVGVPLQTSDYCAAVRKGDVETLKILNEGIEALEKNGTLDKINKKWFGEFLETGEKWRSLVFWIGGIALALGVLLLFIGWINRKLKIEVERRTEEIIEMNEELKIQDLQKWHIINAITNGIVVFNRAGQISLFNHSASEIADTKLKKELHWSEIPICKSIGLDFFEKAFEEKNEYRSTIGFLKSNGSTVFIDYCITAVSYQIDLNDEVILLLHDYTQEKIFYDVLNQNEKLSTIGRMSASIAHELRNPLSSIKQYVDLMPSKLEDARFMNQVLKVIPSELNRLNDIISNFLDYTKFTETKKEWAPLKELIDDLTSLMKVEMVNKRIRLIMDIEPIKIYTDPKHLKQVLINLLINAINAIEESEREGAIKIVVVDRGNVVVLQVIDNGVGIDPSMLSEVFKPYYTTKESGYGIGLSICKQLIEENGGSIQITSELGTGTTVSLIFPMPNIKETC